MYKKFLKGKSLALMSLKIGSIVNGKVSGITNFGAFVTIDSGEKGMVHISEVSRSYVDDIKNVLKIGQAVTCKVVSVSDDGKIALSIKQAQPDDNEKSNQKPKRQKYTPAPRVTSPGDFIWENEQKKDATFEDMMSKFKRTSEDKMSDLKRGENRGYSRRGNGSGRK